MQIQNFYIQSIRKQLLVGFFIGFWLFLFFYYVEPFDMYQLPKPERLLATFGYTIVGMLSYFVTIPLQRLLYKTAGKWTLVNEGILLVSLIVISGGIAYIFFKFILLENDPYAHSFSYFFTQQVIPTVFLLLPVMIFLRWIFGDKTVTESISVEPKEKNIVIKGENKAEVLHLKEAELVFIESANNYVKVHYLLQNELKNELFRNKISVLQEEFPFLLKTHRSFLINPIHFLEWKRESAQTILLLKPNLTQIPVSKTYKKTLIEKFINPSE
ncbi:LytTR family transcriptional regulator DNA-binding domain-containing protein [uncultured Kordia sp.]|uniref:LytTR family DNA-binding domain-containing protein n=1 Tax=uncultured Kordia sp. TaxID=507699 RepID=UPI002620EBA6|nr:LytTR family transcriptional regulator DNA-binding domain-containing protein [uncultured Kordia sp.]